MSAPAPLPVREPSPEDMRAMLALIEDASTNAYVRAVLLREFGGWSEQLGMRELARAGGAS